MSLTASLLSGYNTIRERRIKEKCRNNGLGKSNRSADTPFENLLHILCLFQERSPAGLLVLEKFRSPFYSQSVLTNREMLYCNVSGCAGVVGRLIAEMGLTGFHLHGVSFAQSDFGVDFSSALSYEE